VASNAVFNDGRFETVQLVIGMTSVCIGVISIMFSMGFMSKGFSHFVLLSSKFWETNVVQPAVVDLGCHPMAGIARFNQLTSSYDQTSASRPFDSDNLKSTESGSLQPSPLFQHDPLDQMCPCRRCGDSLARNAGRLRLLEVPARVSLLYAFTFTLFFTPFFTFANQFWSTPWCIVFGVFSLLNHTDTHVINNLSRFIITIYPVRLAQRIRQRAVVLALGDLLAKLRLASETGSVLSAAPPASETYVVLHSFLAEAWRRGFVSGTTGSVSMMMLYCGVPILCAIANAVGAR
jgi:hypothetical protein